MTSRVGEALVPPAGDGYMRTLSMCMGEVREVLGYGDTPEDQPQVVTLICSAETVTAVVPHGAKAGDRVTIVQAMQLLGEERNVSTIELSRADVRRVTWAAGLVDPVTRLHGAIAGEAKPCE